MKLIKGWWVPDYDDNMHLNIRDEPEFAGRSTYQFYAIAKAFPHIRNFRTAVDIGAHVGLWSHVFSRCFSSVFAFEPMASHAECFRGNLINAPNVVLHEVALGERAGPVEMAIKPPVSLKARVHSIETGLPLFPATMRTLDSFDITGPVDLIKIDCEGYEVNVLHGGEVTIRRDHPLMIVEQKGPNTGRYGFVNTEVVSLLTDWGAELIWDHRGDVCMGWQG